MKDDLIRLRKIRDAIIQYDWHQEEAVKDESKGEMLDGFKQRRLAKEALEKAIRWSKESMKMGSKGGV